MGKVLSEELTSGFQMSEMCKGFRQTYWAQMCLLIGEKMFTSFTPP